MNQNKDNKKRRALRIAALSLSALVTLSACQNNSAGEKPKNVSDEVGTSTVGAAEQKENKTVALRVIASTDAIYDFTKAIGKERVEVVDLVEGDADAHHWEPTPQLLTQINEADLFLVNGAGLESWLPDVQASLTGNVKTVDLSDGVQLRKGEEEHDHEDGEHDDHEEGDDHEHDESDHEKNEEHDHHHGEYDPHYWLNPKAAAVQAKNIYDTLVAADPEGKETYDANYKVLQEKFAALERDYAEKLKPYSGRSVIVPHEAFGYLFDAYGLKQIGLEGMLADGQPNAKKIAEIIDLAKKEAIKTVFYEAYGDDKEAQTVAMEIGAKTAPLYTLEAESMEDRAKGEDYFTFMQRNLEAIVDSFGGK